MTCIRSQRRILLCSAMLLALLQPFCGAQTVPRPAQQATAEDRTRLGLPLDADITRPVVVSNPIPEFSEQARRAKISGTVLLKMKLDQRGKVTDVTVVKGIGYGLDEKAMDAARHYRFRPATEDGKAIPWEMNVEISFYIR